VRAAPALRVARIQLRDTLRERRAVVTVVFAPLGLWLVFAFLPLMFLTRGETSDANLRATIAVSSNTPHEVVRALRTRLRVLVEKDPAAAVVFDAADAGMEFSGNPRADLAAGRALRVHELTHAGRTKSTMTLGIAEGVLGSLRAEQRGVAPFAQRVETVQSFDVDQSRGLISRSAPLLFMISLSGIIQLSAQAFLSGRALRTLEALLVLPLRRSELLSGLALASAAVGLLGAVALLLPFSLATLALANHHGGNGALGTATVLAVIVAVTAFFFAALGLAVGVSGRTLNAARVRAGIATFGVTGVGLLMGLSGTIAHAEMLRLLPVTGAMVLLRDAVVGTATAAHTLQAIAISAAAGALCFAYARRYLNSERVTTRA
jgi:ABC-type Na+ efflux pump permease subunit